MATSAPNTTPDPRPTGDLEHLFRQKFAEAEVTPRADLWEQLDHELLVEQNNTYRRRLSLHRWVAAACLLLLLSVSGWALLHQWQPSVPGVAVQRVTGSSASRAEVAANTQAGPASAGATTPATAHDNANSDASASATDELLALEDERRTTATQQNIFADEASQSSNLTASNGAARRSSLLSRSGLYPEGGVASAASGAGGYAAHRLSGMGLQRAENYSSAESGLAVSGSEGVAPRFASLRGGWLGSRPDTLKASLLAAPQPAIGALAAAQDQTRTPAKQWRRLRLGGSYAAAAYNPNIDFSNNNGRVQADLVSNALRDYYQEDAEAEYRRNLRAGLSHRVAFTAAYALNKRWTLTSGVEAGEQRATSATSYDFVDGRQVSRGAAALFDNSYSFARASPATVAPAPTRKASYRYRTVAVPVQIRYGSQRSGASLYAKVGAAVGLLLSAKSELQEAPVATRFTANSATDASRTYSLTASDSPYRKVQASVRGGAGMRYQPANANWNLALGPTAEMGLNTLNANPSQRGLNQSRPYSIGVEATVEFGRPKPMPTAQ